MDISLPADTPGHSHSQNRYNVYVQIAMILAVITGTEILLIFLPFAKWLVIGSLVMLSAVKFMFVIFFFMHLRWDKLLCTCVFFIGLVLGGGTLWALVSLFGAAASVPLSSQP
ncbi:MAG TPA: cytochrome C oxidase subunit IV family protein [Opitutaceae bacterium]|jgi:cytochrome c oxidase subunit 4|nr:cytochrome C oxidase subunit IV family protein [Opitutaceae bacterium]